MTALPSPPSPAPGLADLFKIIRKRSGKSQDALAFRAGCDRSLVSYAENGKRRPTPELFSVYLELAGTDPDMHRRLVLAAATAGAAATLLPSEALAQRLDDSLNVDVEYWEAKVAQLGCDHMRLGSSVMDGKLFNELIALDEANRSGQLTHQIAKLTVLYARAQANPVEAATYNARAQQYASMSADADTIAWVNGRIALGLSDNPATSHRSGAYADLALAQESATGTVGHLGAYLAHYAKARAAAVLNQADAALSHLEQARYAYDAIDPDVDGSEWSYAHARFESDNSFVLAAVGREHEAAEWADQARTGVTGRFKTHLALHALVGRHRAGDPTAATEARALMDAIAPEQQSVTLRHVAAQAGAREYLAAA